MAFLETFALLVGSKLTNAISKFNQQKDVQKAKERSSAAMRDYLNSQFGNINSKLDKMIASPMNSGFALLDMAKNSSGSAADQYMQQALYKFIEAASYMNPSSEDWSTIYHSIAMCQFYNKDYLNAIRSLDKSMESIISSKNCFGYIKKEDLFYSEKEQLYNTLNLIAEFWIMAARTNPMVKRLKDNYQYEEFIDVFNQNIPIIHENFSTDFYEVCTKAEMWPITRERYDDNGYISTHYYPEINFKRIC